VGILSAGQGSFFGCLRRRGYHGSNHSELSKSGWCRHRIGLIGFGVLFQKYGCNGPGMPPVEIGAAGWPIIGHLGRLTDGGGMVLAAATSIPEGFETVYWMWPCYWCMTLHRPGNSAQQEVTCSNLAKHLGGHVWQRTQHRRAPCPKGSITSVSIRSRIADICEAHFSKGVLLITHSFLAGTATGGRPRWTP